MTESVWLVKRLTFDGDEIEGLFASIDSVRAAFPDPLVWEDISSKHGQEWKAELPADDDNPWGTEYRAELMVVE